MECGGYLGTGQRFHRSYWVFWHLYVNKSKDGDGKKVGCSLGRMVMRRHVISEGKMRQSRNYCPIVSHHVMSLDARPLYLDILALVCFVTLGS